MNLLNLAHLYDNLALTNGLVRYSLTAAWSFLAALAVLTASFAFIRAAFLGDMRDPVGWILRLLLVVGLLASYNPLVDAMVGASQDLTEVFIERAGWHEYWANVTEQFKPMFEDEDVNHVAEAGSSAKPPERPSITDRLLGFLRGSILTVVVSVSYFVEFLAFLFIRELALVFIAFLRVLGPLLIAAGILGDGKTIRQWFSAMCNVLLWPIVPPFAMMIILGGSARSSDTGNIAFVIAQNLIVAALGLAAPLIVSFILGRGGVASLIGAASMAGLGALKLAAGTLGAFGSVGGATAGAAAGAAGRTGEALGGRALSDQQWVSRPGEAARNALFDPEATQRMRRGRSSGGDAERSPAALVNDAPRPGPAGPDAATGSIPTADLPAHGREWANEQVRPRRKGDITAPPPAPDVDPPVPHRGPGARGGSQNNGGNARAGRAAVIDISQVAMRRAGSDAQNDMGALAQRAQVPESRVRAFMKDKSPADKQYWAEHPADLRSALEHRTNS